MDFKESDQQRRIQQAWQAVHIARPVHYSLFTCGETILPYFLICGDSEARTRSGEITFTLRSVENGS